MQDRYAANRRGLLPVVGIVGPTSAGKTALAVQVGLRVSAEVVSADSRQVYRGMDIGTAKPTPQERARVPHHMINVVEPTQEFSLAAYLELARTAIQDIQRRGKLPLLVGGTGQYLWALLEGWRVPPVAPDPVFRQELVALAQTEGLAMLNARLAQVDPGAAATIDHRNQRRIIRALEVYHQTGVPWSENRRRASEPVRHLVLGMTLPRVKLYTRIDSRVEWMIRMGWLEEVRSLLDKKLTLEHPSMASIGYRELAAALSNDMVLKEVIPKIKTGTHRFARHQYSWFRLTDPRIHWLQVGIDVEARARGLVKTFLAGSDHT